MNNSSARNSSGTGAAEVDKLKKSMLVIDLFKNIGTQLCSRYGSLVHTKFVIQEMLVDIERAAPTGLDPTKVSEVHTLAEPYRLTNVTKAKGNILSLIHMYSLNNEYHYQYQLRRASVS